MLTGNRNSAEEIVQDAFVAVHRNWDRATSPGGYLRTTGVNNARTWHRRRALEERHLPGRPVDAGAPAPLSPVVTPGTGSSSGARATRSRR